MENQAKLLRLVRFVTGQTILFIAFFFPSPCQAYVGPGAGFAFLGSAAVFLLTAAMAVFTFAFWPLQWIWRRLTGKRLSPAARSKRIVIVGLDGLEPSLIEKYMQEGKLPNFKALQEEGCFSRLQSTLPPLSPVAWSTFQTGVNPGAHNIFDFLTRDKRFCLPLLSSTKTDTVGRGFRIGKLRFWRPRAKIQLLRKSQPFWKVLGEHGIFSNIIRVPISYPPESFHGNILSAMCTPDLRGTQGSFCVYTTADLQNRIAATGGEFKPLKRHSGRSLEAYLEGPPDPNALDGSPLRVPFRLTLEGTGALLEIGDEKEQLALNTFSRWVPVRFHFGLGRKIEGICRFCLRRIEPEIFLYVSPINVSPENPALPISYPIYFSRWLAKRNGLFGTLGLMEDTWGRNEQVLDDQRFLEQTYLTHEERRRMFFDALDRTSEGLCVCVFDISDRIQHMFWRYLDPSHPAARESGNGCRFENVIPDMYQKLDQLIGDVRAKLKADDSLIVLSDHGFVSFRRCINLNTWLYKEGYLVLKEDVSRAKGYLQDVDWSKTRAFAIGLTGIYLNRAGRERWGIVKEAEAAALEREIAEKLESLRDPQNNQQAIRRVYCATEHYRGLYSTEAPDLIVSSEPGYRVSWESVTGGIEAEVFSDNTKAWSGDHDVCPDAVPGVLFSNRRLKAKNPAIVDIAPSVLDLFAVPIPAYMEGKSLF